MENLQNVMHVEFHVISAESTNVEFMKELVSTLKRASDVEIF